MRSITLRSAPGGSSTRRTLDAATCRLRRALAEARSGQSASKTSSSNTGRSRCTSRKRRRRTSIGRPHAPSPACHAPRRTSNRPSSSEERRVGKECRSLCDWSSDVCSSDLVEVHEQEAEEAYVDRPPPRALPGLPRSAPHFEPSEQLEAKRRQGER